MATKDSVPPNDAQLQNVLIDCRLLQAAHDWQYQLLPTLRMLRRDLDKLLKEYEW